MPDLKEGVDAQQLREGEPFLGEYEGQPVVVVRQGDGFCAVGATCTHYGGPLAEGIVVGNTIRCPWHHARFDLRTGAVVGAAALDALPCFEVRRQGGKITVHPKAAPAMEIHRRAVPASVVIVGAGPAGAACAEMLRAQGYAGTVTMVGDEPPGPVDRPNLSKDYLAGSMGEEGTHLRTPDRLKEAKVELILYDPAQRVDPSAHTVALRSGRKLPYGKLLLATGAEPRPLNLPAENGHKPLYLRTLADSQAIIARAEKARRCVVVGASFIGLEVAASLRQRKLEVEVVGPEEVPLARVLGPELGAWVRRLHESHGVRFHMNAKPVRLHAGGVDLSTGKTVAADMVVVGIGVAPRTALAETAGLRVDNGIWVDEFLCCTQPDIYAAGDVARYPDPLSGERVRIEHFVLAERQGQAAARHMLGEATAFADAPFFWSQHYDAVINYVGHASTWDRIAVEGDLDKRDARVLYWKGERLLAVATLGRDRESLTLEAAMETRSPQAVSAALGM